MPGFTTPFASANHAGIATKSAQAESKRKHRWIFTVFWESQDLLATSTYLQSASRPHAVTEEAVIHHDEEQAYFAGKYHWEPINLVFYDMLNPQDSSQSVYDWFNGVIQVSQATVEAPDQYKKTTQLDMTDGGGNAVEAWACYNSWPIDVNWNDLDYTNTEIQTIDVVMKFDRAEKIT